MVMVADAVGVSLIGCFVTPFISKSIKDAHKYIDEENKSLKNVNPKLKELADHLDGIRVTVDKVGLCFIKNGTGEAVEHLWRLKGAIYEAEEILDLYDSLKNNRLSCEFAQQFTGTKDSPSRLEEVVEKLGRLGLSTRELLQNSHNIVHGSPILHRGPSQSEANSGNGFFGYVEERRQLQNLLRGEQNKVIAIIGHGGMGKTHLARQVFDANEPGFEVRIWAHVCNKLDQIELLTEICRSPINKSGAPMIHGPIMETVAALESVVEGLSKSSWLSKRTKTCLVVLDDVWQHEEGFAGPTRISRAQRNEAWASVLAMLRGLKSCKVVMTTRDKVCSTTLKADETIVLDGISQEPMEELLKHIAKSDQPPQGLAQRIGKLKGSPRAALSIVQELKIANSKTEEKIILRELDHKNHIQGLYEDHLFTYHNLPLHLQSCLAFCSVFPYNWKFQREKLTKMWIAHGFIDDTQVQQHKLAMEGVAKGYFKDLVDRSLFKIDTDGLYVIHVHIHSMIRRVSGDDCMSISNGSSSEIMVPATVCHLSVTAGCLAKLKPGPPLEKTRQAVKSNGKPEDEFRTVRTLIVLTDKGAPSSPWSDIREANSTLRKFKRVKVLDLTDTAITQVPDGVSELTHLRYLGVPHTVRHRPAHFTNLLLFYIDHEATKTAPLMQSAAPLHNPGGGGAGKAPLHNPGGGGAGKAPLPNPGGGGLHNPGGGGAGKAPLQYNPGGGGGAGKAPLPNPGGGGAGKAPLPNPGGGGLHNPGGGGAGKAPLQYNPGGGGGAGKTPLQYNPGGGGAGKAPLHNSGGGGAGKAPLHNPGSGGAGKTPLQYNSGGGGAGKAPLHNPVGGGAGKAPLHNPGAGGPGKAPLHNPGSDGAGKTPLQYNPGGGGAGKAPLHNPGSGGAGKAPLHNPGGGGAGKAPLQYNPGGGGGPGKTPLQYNSGGGGAGKAPLHNPVGGGAGKAPLHNPGAGGPGKAPLHNPGSDGAGKAPLHKPVGGGAGKAPLHNPGADGPGKAPLHNPGGGGPAKAPLHNPGGGGAGKAPLHNLGAGGAGKAPLHNPGGGGGGKAPLHNPGGGVAGKAHLHNPGGGGAGKAPLHNPGAGGAGKAPLHNPGAGGAGKAHLHNPGGGGPGKAPLHNPGGGGAGKAPLHNPGGGRAGKATLHNPDGGGPGNPGGGRAGKAPLPCNFKSI